MLGLEPNPDLYIAHIVEIFREIRRVLRKDGTVWANWGDSYAGQPHYSGHGLGKSDSKLGGFNDGTRKSIIGNGLKPKDLCMMPARVALALSG